MERPPPVRKRGPERIPLRGAAAGASALLAAAVIGCAGGGGEGQGFASPRPWIGPREASRALPSIPESTPAVVGKPYRDLRRHTTLPMGEVSGIDVSPDGGSLLFASTGDGPTPNLYIRKEGSAGVVRKTSGRFWDIQPRYSPDGRWIAFASDRDGNFDVWIIPAEGAGGSEQVTRSPDDEVHPAWSPDGRKIAFSRLSARHGWTLWILDREDGGVVELGPGLFPDWSPTGEWIAFQKPSDGPDPRFGLWIIRPDGSEVRQVAAGDAFSSVDPAWSPAGDLLAFCAVRAGPGDARKSEGGRIWIVEMARGRLYRLTDGPGMDSSPAWGLGGRIYFVSSRLETPSIWSLLPPEVEG